MINGGTPKMMVYKGKSIYKWMIGGYHHFRKNHHILFMDVYGRFIMVEGSLEVKLPTIWTDEKQSRGEAERRGRLEERR